MAECTGPNNDGLQYTKDANDVKWVDISEQANSAEAYVKELMNIDEEHPYVNLIRIPPNTEIGQYYHEEKQW